MKSEIKIEIDRLKNILESNGLKFVVNEGANAQKNADVEAKTGINFDDNLKDFWRFSNGSNEGDSWFCVFSDEVMPCSFLSIEEALETWSLFLPYDDSIYEQLSDFETKRDERIQPIFLQHRLWFPFAEFGGSTTILFDGNPTDKGSYGQIIVYQHDPDAIYYVAENFLEFFKKSNDLLQANVKELLL
ncbi:MAG TPA: SMI1/KNR4 family protein [Pyrinomonadaceae bacterium]|nr:SMI1/KNR4 family protein [Pyrinomonadaceae bacterium]